MEIDDRKGQRSGVSELSQVSGSCRRKRSLSLLDDDYTRIKKDQTIGDRRNSGRAGNNRSLLTQTSIAHCYSTGWVGHSITATTYPQFLSLSSGHLVAQTLSS